VVVEHNGSERHAERGVSEDIVADDHVSCGPLSTAREFFIPFLCSSQCSPSLGLDMNRLGRRLGLDKSIVGYDAGDERRIRLSCAALR
jgi:hypothetical protein